MHAAKGENRRLRHEKVLSFHVKHGSYNSVAYLEPGEIAVGLPSASMDAAVPEPFDVAVLEHWINEKKGEKKGEDKARKKQTVAKPRAKAKKTGKKGAGAGGRGKAEANTTEVEEVGEYEDGDSDDISFSCDQADEELW